MDRKKIILIVLVAIFIISLAYRIMHPFKQERVAELTYSPKRVYVKSIKKSEDLTDAKASATGTIVLLDLFKNPPRHKAKVIKNVFQETRAEKTVKPTDVAQKREQKKAVPVVPKKETPIELAKKDLSSLKAFGMYESGGEKVVFLERGKEVLVVRKGDRINGKYVIEQISSQRITLKSKQFNESVYIDVGEL
jgi:Tfp pilus assembly protein PilP